MIERYSTYEMAEIWSERGKFNTWLNVEIAILRAKARRGLIPSDVPEKITRQAEFQVKRIKELEAEIKHDMLAFVTNVQEHLEPDLQGYFHSGITSYDVEEPAMVLLMLNSLGIICGAVDHLADSVAEKAKQYKYLVKIQRTHGQHAQLSTVGLEFLWWYDSIVRQRPYLELALEEIRSTKISGAVGTYEGNLSPTLETEALELLGLKPAPISMQIILRDRHAHLMNALAVLAGVLENIALNVELMGQTEICEFQEFFGSKQKGSSIMPHKKNTIISENLRGLARTARHLAGMALENIPTWSARDISQSSVERIVFPEMFHLLHFMLRRTQKLVEGLVVNERNIELNLRSTKGRIFSPDVKELLVEESFDPDTAYRIAQECAFESMKTEEHYLSVLLGREDLSENIKEKLKQSFDSQKKIQYVDEIFQRLLL